MDSRSFAVGAAVASGVCVAAHFLAAWKKRPKVAFKAGAYGFGRHVGKKGAVVIRLATAKDAGTILAHIQGLAVYEKEPVSTVEVTQADLRAHGFGSQPRFQCILAEIEGESAGFALLYPSYSTWQGPCLYLEDLFVHDKFRGCGLGGLLLKTAAALASAQGCKRMHWQALDWNTPALDFYERIGATKLDEWVSLRLSRPGIAALLK